MSDSLYVNDNGTPVPLNLGTGIEFVERIEALEGDVSDLNAFKTTQSTRDSQQDSAIQQAQTAASNAINDAVTSAVIDGLDLVLTYGNGTTKRVPLPTGKGVGDMWFGVDQKSKPANVQTYSGQLLSRSAYPAHWAFVNGGNRTVISESQWQAQVSANGFCPYYSSGDGSTTYRMPILKGVHPKFVAALAEAGQYLEAGLPNITGSAGDVRGETSEYADWGALSFVRSKTSSWGGGYSANNGHIDIDASKSNPIYGKSDTVQPPSVTCVLGEYVVGSVTVIGEADSVALLEAINMKADAGVGGKGVVRSVNGKGADAAGNVAVTVASLDAQTYSLAGRITSLYSNTNGVNGANITLSQPYTNFRALVFVLSDKNKYHAGVQILPVWSLQQAIALNPASMTLFYGNLYWSISSSSTTTNLVVQDSSACKIYKIYGVN